LEMASRFWMPDHWQSPFLSDSVPRRPSHRSAPYATAAASSCRKRAFVARLVESKPTPMSANRKRLPKKDREVENNQCAVEKVSPAADLVAFVKGRRAWRESTVCRPS
jgi:hypothetical protein